MTIPTLETQRLTLRPMTMGDFEAYCEMMASERSRHMGGPFDLTQSWGWFCHDIAQWHLFGHGGLMIDLKSTGACVGQVGINDGPLFPGRELGWLLFDGQEGMGYATEAAQRMRDWALGEGGFDQLVSYCSADNFASRAVAERIGGVLDPEAEVPDPGDVAYRHREG